MTAGIVRDSVRRTLDNFIPFLVGLIIGVLGAFASFTRGQTMLESEVGNHEKRLAQLETTSQSTHDLLLEIAAQLRARGFTHDPEKP